MYFTYFPLLKEEKKSPEMSWYMLWNGTRFILSRNLFCNVKQCPALCFRMPPEHVIECVPECRRTCSEMTEKSMVRNVSESSRMSHECWGISRKIFRNIPGNAPECFRMSSGMSWKCFGIVWNVPECSGTYSGMSKKYTRKCFIISRNKFWNVLEHVKRCPGMCFSMSWNVFRNVSECFP